MDSLTHLVAGALTPLAFRGTPKRAAVIGFGIAVGELPDIDILFGVSAEALLALHRGITHSLIWQPVLVLIAVLPFYIWLHCRGAGLIPIREAPTAARAACMPGSDLEPGPDGLGAFGFGRMYCVALFAVFTHIYLDCMTTFGTQALLPFSGLRVGFAAMFIVDLLMTLPILALLTAALRQPPDIVPPVSPRRRGSEPAAPGLGYAFVSGKSRRLARIGLAWVLLYPLLSLSVNHIAAAVLGPSLTEPPLSAQTGDGNPPPRFAPDRLVLMTEPFSPFVWKAIVDQGDSWRTGTLRLLSPGDTRLDREYAKPEPLLYETLKKQHPIFAMFEDFAPLMTQRERPAEPLVQKDYMSPVTEYSFLDLRYVIAPDSPARLVGRNDPNFVLEARVNEGGALLAYRFLQRGKDKDTPWTVLE